MFSGADDVFFKQNVAYQAIYYFFLPEYYKVAVETKHYFNLLNGY